jgi:hypothetical protein
LHGPSSLSCELDEQSKPSEFQPFDRLRANGIDIRQSPSGPGINFDHFKDILEMALLGDVLFRHGVLLQSFVKGLSQDLLRQEIDFPQLRLHRPAVVIPAQAGIQKL